MVFHLLVLVLREYSLQRNVRREETNTRNNGADIVDCADGASSVASASRSGIVENEKIA